MEERGSVCFPAAGQRRAVCAADTSNSRQIPDYRLTRARIEQQIIWMAVAIKVRDADQAPACRESWTVSTTNANVVVHVPNRCLACTCIVKQKIRLPVGVKVSWLRWRYVNVINVFLLIECCGICSIAAAIL